MTAAADATQPGTAPTAKTGRRWGPLVLRLVLSSVLLAVLVWRMPDVEVRAIVPRMTLHTELLLLGAAAATAAALVLSALRWQAVLNALGHDVHPRRLLSHTLAGQFVSNVLPTTIGGDALRVSRLSRDCGRTAESFASVVLERMTGWVVLPAITLFALAVNPGLRELGTASAVAAGIAVGSLVLLGAVLVAVSSPALGRRLGGDARWHRFAGAVHLGVAELRRRPRLAVQVLATSLLYQLVLVLAALLAAKVVGMGAPAGPTALLAFFPAVQIAQVLPLSISGLGVREGALVLFLQPLGIPTEQSIALGLLLYLLNLVVSLAGAPSFALGGRRELAAAAVLP